MDSRCNMDGLPAPVGPVKTTNSPARKPLHISDKRGNEGDCEPTKTAQHNTTQHSTGQISVKIAYSQWFSVE